MLNYTEQACCLCLSYCVFFWIFRYKSDLVKSAKREEALERNMQQVKLDCRRKYEDAESDAYVKVMKLCIQLQCFFIGT